MPNPVEGLFEVYEDMVEVLLVLEIFLTTSCSEVCLFSSLVFSACGLNLFSMIFSMTLLGWLMRLIV